MLIKQGVSKRALQLWKLMHIYSEDMYSVLNCHNVAKHAEFYLGQLRFEVTSTGNTGCFRKSFRMVFQMLLCSERRENVYTERRTTTCCKRFRNTGHTVTFGIAL
jgi:hypothetical protein